MEPSDRQQDVEDRIREEAQGAVLRLTADKGGFLVVQQLPDDPTPYLYRVSVEKNVDGSDSLHWDFLGPVTHSEAIGDDSQTTSEG